jgi:hypothetical protein
MVQERDEKDKEFDNIVDTLLELPIKNLFSRIYELENEIHFRQSLRDNALTKLSTHQLRLKEKLRQLRYASSDTALSRKMSFEFEIIKLESQKINERLTYFRDITGLQERIQQAKEELAIKQNNKRLI